MPSTCRRLSSTNLFVDTTKSFVDTAAMSRTSLPRPTDAELAILRILWDRGPSTVRQVHEVLGRNRQGAYTTALKLLQIMSEKGLVERDTTEKIHRYKALISREQAQNTALDKILDTVFKGSTADLVIQALGQHRASKDEIDAIKKYLQQFEKQ